MISSPYSASTDVGRALRRAPMLAVGAIVLAVLALLPLSALLAQAPAQVSPASSSVGSVATQATSSAHKADTSAIPVIDGEVHNLVLKGKQLEVSYQNTGTLSTIVTGELQVRDSAGELVATAPIVERKKIEAGRSEKFRLPMPQLSAGTYTLYAVVDFGGATLTAAQAALTVQP